MASDRKPYNFRFPQTLIDSIPLEEDDTLTGFIESAVRERLAGRPAAVAGEIEVMAAEMEADSLDRDAARLRAMAKRLTA